MYLFAPPRFRKLARAAMAYLLISIIAAPSFAALMQSGPTGSLTGVVSDQSGAVVAGATVTITKSATKISRTISTDQEGRWKVSALDEIGRAHV